MNLSRNFDFISSKIGRQPFNSDFRSADLLRRQPGRPPLRLRQRQPLPIQSALFLPGGEGHQQRAQHLRPARPADRDRQRLHPGLPGARIPDAVQHPLRPRPREEERLRLRQPGLPRPPRSGRHRQAARPRTSFYLGWTSEGHIGLLNVSHAIYEALGHDTSNPIAGREVNINAQMAFLELSVDRDWMRYQTSVFYSSGDRDPRDGTATRLRLDPRQSQDPGRRFRLLEPAEHPHRRPRRRRADAARTASFPISAAARRRARRTS